MICRSRGALTADLNEVERRFTRSVIKLRNQRKRVCPDEPLEGLNRCQAGRHFLAPFAELVEEDDGVVVGDLVLVVEGVGAGDGELEFWLSSHEVGHVFKSSGS